MSPSPSRLAVLSLALLALTGFRMPAKEDAAERLLYDVRGAFVTAQPDVPRNLITWTDSLVDSSIQATTRSFILPRTILTVRIAETTRTPVLFGTRHSAAVMVKVISVGSGDPVAEGDFDISVLTFGKQNADNVLAGKIAERIASEFQLVSPRNRAVITALTEQTP